MAPATGAARRVAAGGIAGFEAVSVRLLPRGSVTGSCRLWGQGCGVWQAYGKVYGRRMAGSRFRGAGLCLGRAEPWGHPDVARGRGGLGGLAALVLSVGSGAVRVGWSFTPPCRAGGARVWAG